LNQVKPGGEQINDRKVTEYESQRLIARGAKRVRQPWPCIKVEQLNKESQGPENQKMPINAAVPAANGVPCSIDPAAVTVIRPKARTVITIKTPWVQIS
jgi:hypothetical protein